LALVDTALSANLETNSFVVGMEDLDETGSEEEPKLD
jgi:hypothetical protein